MHLKSAEFQALSGSRPIDKGRPCLLTGFTSEKRTKVEQLFMASSRLQEAGLELQRQQGQFPAGLLTAAPLGAVLPLDTLGVASTWTFPGFDARSPWG